MQPLWTAEQAAEATHGKTTGTWQAARVVIDSRTVQAGDLFVAIKGERMDGHAFAAEAVGKGAAAVMVSHEIEGVPVEKQLKVADVQAALEALAIFARARTKAKIVGVTGSVGKTSTKEMLRIALAAHGNTFASYGNFNNHIGTPLNLANLPIDAQFAVFEMGMNHAGEIAQLTALVKPHVAIITNVEPVHLEFFDSVDKIADAKSEIFEGLVEVGAAVLNRDNPQFERCAQHAKQYGVERVISFGSADADIQRVSCNISMKGTEVQAKIGDKTYQYRLGAIGEHWATTSLMALATAQAFGLDIEKTAASLSTFMEPEGRGRLVRIAVSGGEALLLDDSYNASPAAMRAAFAKARAVANGGDVKRVLAALGEMRELGKTGPELHAGLAASLIENTFDAVFTAWPLMEHLQNALPAAMRTHHAPDAKTLLPIVQEALRPGDLLLVKGSHGSLMYQLAEALKNNTPAQKEKYYAV